MTFTNRVDTLTLDYLAPQVVDTVLRGNVFATAMLAKTKKFRSSTMDFPIKYQKGVAGVSFSGFDVLPTSASDTRVLMVFNPRFYAINVALPGTEIAANNTIQKVMDLATVEMRSRAQDLADDIGTILYADGTGNGNKDFLGLGAVVDDGSSVATIGGLSRSTYSTLASTVTASSGTLSLAKLRTLKNAIADASVEPTVSYTTYAINALYESLLQPQERIMKDVKIAENFKGYTGFKSLEFAGLPMISDRKCTSGVLFFLNEDFLDFYALPTAIPQFGGEPVPVASKLFVGNSYNEVGSLGFSWTGWIKSTNQFAFNSFITLGGNLITDNPRRHGKLTGITSV
jgi:hypothetical protein